MRAIAGGDWKWSTLRHAVWILFRFAAISAAFWAWGFYITPSSEALQNLGTEAHSFSSGTEIWVPPGYDGPVDIYSSTVRTGNGAWSAEPTITLVLRAPGLSKAIEGTSSKTEDWGNVGPYLSTETVVMKIDIAVPAEATVGTVYTGSLTGTITTCTDFDSMVLPEAHNLNLQNITLHVVTPEEVTQHASAASVGLGPWILIQWGLSSLALLLGLVVFVRIMRGKRAIPAWIIPGR